MDVIIRPLEQQDLAEADRIFRTAFGTFLGMPDPMQFTGDADLVNTRWKTDPEGAIGAYVDDALVGSVFSAPRGSLAILGPLSVRPDRWDQGIARKLMAAAVDRYDAWGIRQAVLFTFPNSLKHIGLYQRSGFWPQHLTPLMGKAVSSEAGAGHWSTYSRVPASGRDQVLYDCRAITHALLPGLDFEREIRAVDEQQLGDTILLREGGELAGFATCHVGKGSEAESGSAYVKFGAVRPGSGAADHFGRLLSACEALARERGAAQLIAGVNSARHDAYRMMLDHGFRAAIVGVAMQRPNDPGLNRPDCFVIDDCR